MMKGRGKGRGFTPNACRMSTGTRGPPPSPHGVGGEPVSGEVLTGDTAAPYVPEGVGGGT